MQWFLLFWGAFGDLFAYGKRYGSFLLCCIWVYPISLIGLFWVLYFFLLAVGSTDCGVVPSLTPSFWSFGFYFYIELIFTYQHLLDAPLRYWHYPLCSINLFRYGSVRKFSSNWLFNLSLRVTLVSLLKYFYRKWREFFCSFIFFLFFSFFVLLLYFSLIFIFHFLFLFYFFIFLWAF